jgi:hypothetical protein
MADLRLRFFPALLPLAFLSLALPAAADESPAEPAVNPTPKVWKSGGSKNADACPEPARFAIAAKKGKPDESYVTCDSTKASFEGKPASLVLVLSESRPEMNFTGIVTSGESRQFIELPGPSRGVVAGKMRGKLMAAFEGRSALDCDSMDKVRKEVLELEPVRKGKGGAWKIRFKRPFECRWTENKPSAVGEPLAGRRQWTSRTTGSALVWLRGEETVFELEGLQVSQKSKALKEPEAAPSASPSAAADAAPAKR